MNMVTILFIWTVVAGTGTGVSTYYEKDWRWSGEFSSPQACLNAGAKLGLKPERYRCVLK